jgi:hypothetical protein
MHDWPRPSPRITIAVTAGSAFAGLRERHVLKLVDRQQFQSGAVVLRYEAGQVTGLKIVTRDRVTF